MKTETILVILAIILFGFVLFNPQLFTTTQQYAIIPSCGNNVCDTNKGENYSSCPLDCAICGNNVCEYNKFPSEHFSNCPTDCHQNNGICDYGETCENSEDCACAAGQTCTNSQCKDIVKEEPKKSFFEQEIFPIGEFKVTGLMLVIALGALLIIAFAVGK